MQTSLDIKNPGLRTLPPGVERYFVKGGGLSVIEVSPEDKIEIVNDEGKQTCEIIVFNTKGKSDLSILNLKENSNANFSKKTISRDEKISKLFKHKKFNLDKAKSSTVFDKNLVTYTNTKHTNKPIIAPIIVGIIFLSLNHKFNSVYKINCFKKNQFHYFLLLILNLFFVEYY